MASLHSKCRNSPYVRAKEIIRCPVPDDKVSWEVDFPSYQPVTFTSARVQETPSWADPELLNKDGKVLPLKKPLLFNRMDDGILRKSFCGPYVLSTDGLPLNPQGRTGIRGRAALGRWGPNHAADPIVTRWKRQPDGTIVLHAKSRLPVLQFVTVLRRDTSEWAIPGGMVDSGEQISETLKREFGEEAMACLEGDAQHQAKIKAIVAEQLRGEGVLVYRGYVDDPRNTDNAWMETQVYNFHDDTGKGLGCVQLKSGDDAKAVQWVDASKELKLYASHSTFIMKTAELLKAHW